MSKYFDFSTICDIVSFQYTIIYSTFKIIGDNLSFMVSKIKSNDRNKNGDVIFFSPIMYAVKIDVRNLETLLNRLLDIITKKTLFYRVPDKVYDLDYPLGVFWLTTLDIERVNPDDERADADVEGVDPDIERVDIDAIKVRTIGDYCLKVETVKKDNIELYAYTILQGYLSLISSLALDLKIPYNSITPITIWKYNVDDVIREMTQEAFFRDLDILVGKVLARLSKFGNTSAPNKSDYHSIRPSIMF